SVRTYRGSVRARLCSSCAPDSWVATKAVPSWTASAPAASAAAIWLPRMMPPAAMTGIETVSRTWATRDSSPMPEPSASGASRWVPWWPPASTPCAITASAPARSTARASAGAVGPRVAPGAEALRAHRVGARPFHGPGLRGGGGGGQRDGAGPAERFEDLGGRHAEVERHHRHRVVEQHRQLGVVAVVTAAVG